MLLYPMLRKLRKKLYVARLFPRSTLTLYSEQKKPRENQLDKAKIPEPSVVSPAYIRSSYSKPTEVGAE